jgi:septal ring factor EnvC (AmiA/AmiB activator)
MSRFLLCCYLAIGTLWYAAYAHADLSEKEQQLQAVSDKIQKLSKTLAKTKNKQEILNKELKQTEIKIADIVQTVQRIEQDKKKTQTELAQLTKQRTQLQSKLRQQQLKLGQEVKAYYEMGRHHHLKLLLDQADTQHINRLATYITYLNKHRKQIIDETELTLENLRQTQQTIERQEAELLTLQESNRQEQAALETNRSYRQQVLTQLKQEITKQDQQLTTLKENQRALEKVIDRLQKQRAAAIAKPFAQMKKKLKWPLKGRITQTFGAPIQENNLISTGIFISADQGNNVTSIHTGEVVFADWLRGYGLLIIVNHGDGYMSLYGHNQTLFKSKGDIVTQGENLASSGNSGGNAKNGLYFEIRHNGKPINPQEWCV